jgi:hypothetical protein
MTHDISPKKFVSLYNQNPDMTRFISKSSALSNESLSAANQQTNGNKSLPAVAAYQSSAPVQRAVSLSASYLPTGNAVGDITNLEAQVAVAEQEATQDVQNGNIRHTNKQTTYMMHPSKRAWGYCVEEKLDIKAGNMGWTTQHRLANSRPDYHQVIDGDDVFVDLTSAGEAGQHGNHITGKLDVSCPNGLRPPEWKGADITHASSDPLGGVHGGIVIGTNGQVTQEHSQYYQDYRRFLDNRDGGDWSPGMQHLLDHYGGPVSNATFTQVWDQNDRDEFVRLAKQEIENDEDSEEYKQYPKDEDMDEESDEQKQPQHQYQYGENDFVVGDDSEDGSGEYEDNSDIGGDDSYSGGY